MHIMNTSEFDIDMCTLMGMPLLPDAEEPLTPLEPLELSYPPTLPKDLAVAPNRLKSILEYHGLTQEQFDELTNSLPFRKDLSRWQKEVTKDGFTLRLRALGMAEDLIPDLHRMFLAPETPSATKVRIMELLLGVAGITTKAEPAPVAAMGATNPINIQINLG